MYFIVYLLHVSANLVAVLREMHYKEYVITSMNEGTTVRSSVFGIVYAFVGFVAIFNMICIFAVMCGIIMFLYTVVC